jgi:hypothetical protein
MEDRLGLHGATLVAVVDDVGSMLPPCPCLSLTGVPCPFCGGTRAVALAAQGDAAFLDYGAGWVLLAAGLVLAAAVLLARGRSPAAVARGAVRTPPRALATIALTLAGPWAWALAHAGTIT